MNKVVLMGRLTRDPEVRYTQGENSMCIARYTLAVDRRFSRSNGDGQTADFIPCVAFGKLGEHAEKYYHKGLKVAVSGRIQTGSYTNKDGQKVFTTEVVIEEQEFAESKGSQADGQNAGGQNASNNGRQGSGQSSQSSQRQNRSQSGSGRNSSQNSNQNFPDQGGFDGFMNIPDGIDEELPFN
jgi:single-strand DNA-binding protein